MTDADRRKAFNICTSTELGCEDNCPYVELDCSYYECLISHKNFARLEIDRQKAEIERLQAEVDKWKCALKNGCELSKCINKGWVMNEAYREFAERLLQKCAIDRGFAVMSDDAINNTLDELTGGKNNEKN